MSRRLKILLGLPPLLLLLVAIWGYQWWVSPLTVVQESSVFVVKEGESLQGLSRRLARQGALKHPRIFSLFGRMSGADQRIRQGEYQLEAAVSPRELLALLQTGDTIRYLVTLPEGIDLEQALNLLQETEGLAAVVEGSRDPRLLAMVAPALTAEGYFLPETYQYQRGDTDLDILREANRLMRLELQQAWDQRIEPLPYEERYEALVMASIIEKETGLASERNEIGGVFVRRLQRDMRLQTDPTVIYGLGASYDGNLRREHLRDASNVYNTYRHHGLPPGPIALPGRAALLAAVQPAPGESLYFVARGDGSHAFSKTLDEHENAVRQFQLRRRADYRSSPVEAK